MVLSENEQLVERYISLEKEFNKLTDKIKTTRVKEAQKAMRAKKKVIRTEQGAIFNKLKYTGYNQVIEERLGLKTRSKALGRRAKRKGL